MKKLIIALLISVASFSTITAFADQNTADQTQNSSSDSVKSPLSCDGWWPAC